MSFESCTRAVSHLGPCVAECVRWTQLNRREALVIFIEDAGYRPETYPAVDAPSPFVYFEQAAALWNDAHPCGPLFEVARWTPGNAAEKEAARQRSTIHFGFRDSDDLEADPLGSMLCTCDEDDNVCANPFHHDDVFGPPSAQDSLFVQQGYMYQHSDPRLRGLSANQYVNVIVHELGHALGMGHVYGLPVESVMGVRPDGAEVVQLFDFDREQLQRRNPCGCSTIIEAAGLSAPEKLVQTGDWCLVCRGEL